MSAGPGRHRPGLASRHASTRFRKIISEGMNQD